MNKKYEVSEEYLEELFDKGSKSLVGKVCKRFEIFEDKEQIKSSVKELIYEHHRTLREYIKAFSKGVKFLTKKPKE